MPFIIIIIIITFEVVLLISSFSILLFYYFNQQFFLRNHFSTYQYLNDNHFINNNNNQLLLSLNKASPKAHRHRGNFKTNNKRITFIHFNNKILNERGEKDDILLGGKFLANAVSIACTEGHTGISVSCSLLCLFYNKILEERRKERKKKEKRSAKRWKRQEREEKT